jgi:flagella basal body P-ring formation protein FlgA
MKFGSAGIAVIVFAVMSLRAEAMSGEANEPILDQARKVLEAKLQERYPAIVRFELRPIQPRARRWVPGDTRAVEVIVPDAKSLARRAVVLVRERLSDGRTADWPIWWSVRAERPVMVVRRAIRQNEPVREQDCFLQYRDVAGMPETIGGFQEIGTNRRARRHIPSGAPLRIGDLEFAPEVAREQSVKVMIGAGPVQIETVGVATKEGRSGEVIQVTNPTSGKRYSALVIGFGEVRVGEATR